MLKCKNAVPRITGEDNDMEYVFHAGCSLRSVVI